MSDPYALASRAPTELLRLPRSLRWLRRWPLPHKLGLLERIYGSRLGAEGIRWVECANGVPWKLDLTDVTQRWCVYGDYEGSVQMNWLRAWLAGGGEVVDSGASIGQMVLYLGRLPGVSIHAFEPTRTSRQWLSECVKRNQFANVQILPWGLSDEASQRDIRSCGSRSTLRFEVTAAGVASCETIALIALDDYMQERSISRLRLWKLDVEYHEAQALAGAARMLHAQTIDAILIEVSHLTFAAVKAQLDQAKYQLWSLDGSGWTPREALPRPGTFNLLAFPLGGAEPGSTPVPWLPLRKSVQ